MSCFLNWIAKHFARKEKKEVNIGKVVFKAVAITVAVIAFVPTVFVKRENGFDAYGLLTRVGYRKTTDDNGKQHRNVEVTLIDVSRYKGENKK